MARYIDADVLLENLKKQYGEDLGWQCTVNMSDIGMMIEDAPTADVVEIPKSGIGDLSDGYHTFNELYHHRAILFSVICNMMPDKAWKSKLHNTGDMFDGMFIVGLETPEGQATYHYDIEPYWDMFKVKELEKAPRWDGHTPTDAIYRIENLSADVVEVKHGEWIDNGIQDSMLSKCSVCGILYGACTFKHCPECGAKMNLSTIPTGCESEG